MPPDCKLHYPICSLLLLKRPIYNGLPVAWLLPQISRPQTQILSGELDLRKILEAQVAER